MGGFLIENAATRASLKSAFDHLFCKYGREFDDDDEIDLQDLSIVRVGGHVLNEKTRGFGSCYKKSARNAEHLDMDVPELPEIEQEDNYDDVFVRISGKVKAAQMRRIHEPLTFSPLPPLRPTRLVEATPKKTGTGKVSSKLSKLILSDDDETDGDEEGRRRKKSYDDHPQHTFDEHLWTLIGLDGTYRPIPTCSPSNNVMCQYTTVTKDAHCYSVAACTLEQADVTEMKVALLVDSMAESREDCQYEAPASKISVKLDLNATFSSVLDTNRQHDDEIFLGHLEDFDPEAVRQSALKFVVRNKMLFITHTNSLFHSAACLNLCNALGAEMRKSCNPAKLDDLSSGTNTDFFRIPSVYGCTAKQGKNFDAYIHLDLEPALRKHPMIVAEVAFRNESFPILIEEGLIALSRFTDAAFSLLINLIETNRPGEVKKVNSIRVLLLERTTAFASDSGLFGTATARHCRKPLTRPLTRAFRSRYPEARVVFDRAFSRDEILAEKFSCVLQLSGITIRNYIGSPEWFPSETVPVSLENFMVEVIKRTDKLVRVNHYPSSYQ